MINELAIDRTYCPVCKMQNFSVLFSRIHNSLGFLDFIKFEEFYSKNLYENYQNGTLSDLKFEIVECLNCKLVYQTQVLNEKGMMLLYNDWLDKDLLKKYYSNIKPSAYEEDMLRVIKKTFRKKIKIKVMDFGAGYGNFCSTAINLGFDTYAFDLSTDKNDHINSMGVTVINKFDAYKEYFDFIYVNQVFEHLANPLEVINNLYNCLSKKGILFIAVPDTSKIKKILREEGLSLKLFKLISPHQHINGFNNNSLKQLGIIAGLRPFSMLDFLKLYNTSFDLNECKFLIKKIIKNSKYGTGLFFTSDPGFQSRQ